MPGVPPDAVDNVKRLLKGIFRRGKNKKQDKVNQQPPASQPVPNTTANQPTSTTALAPAIDKPLPPTHPLASGQHDKPQEAVPQNHSAQPGPEQSAQDVKKTEVQPASAAAPSAGAPTEPAATIAKDTPPAPPPKNDGASDPLKPIDTSANKENVPVVSNVTQPDSAMGTPNTPAKPNGTTEEPKLDTSTSTTTAADATTTKALEEKVPVHAEPTLPKTNTNASGMSATSGPLEDFPEGMAEDKD